jgi:hypothetical protein
VAKQSKTQKRKVIVLESEMELFKKLVKQLKRERTKDFKQLTEALRNPN